MVEEQSDDDDFAGVMEWAVEDDDVGPESQPALTDGDAAAS